jgi:hypothetical protein
MSINKAPQNSSSDEIDFINLLERTFLFFRRYRIAFMIAILVGIAIGCIKYYSSGKMYKSRLILHSSFLTNLEEIEIINSWNELLKRNEYATLAQSLNCSEAMLQKVASLEGSEILKNYSATNPNGFYIDARIFDNSVLPELQKAIVYGLNNTEYVKQKLLLRKKDLEELIANAEGEIQKLDSTRRNVETMIRLVDMNEKLLSYKEELKLANGVQVIQGFVPLNTAVSVSLKVMILLGLILCLSITFILTQLNSFWRQLKKRSSSNA